MIPQVFNLGFIPVNSFGLLICLAMIVGILELERCFNNYGIPKKLAEKFVMWGGFGGLIGARLWYIFVSHYEESSVDLFASLTSAAGFTFYGGFIASFLIINGLIYYHKLNFSNVANSLATTLAIGYAVGRLGCQLSGDGDYGIATDSFLGMSFATGVIPTPPGVTVFPTPLYESAIAIIVYYILRRFQNSNRCHFGTCFAWYLVFMAVERFLVEFLRVELRVASGLTEAQIISIGLFIFGTLWLIAAQTKRYIAEKPLK